MSTLLYDANGAPLVGKNGDPYPDLPLGAYFAKAGLSRAEAISASGECLRRAKGILRRYLRDLEIREPGAARAYALEGNHDLRSELNRKVIAAALLEMGFNTAELRAIEAQMGLGLVSKTKTPLRATVRNPDGSSETYVVERTKERTPSGLGVRLHSETTGIVWH